MERYSGLITRLDKRPGEIGKILGVIVEVTEGQFAGAERFDSGGAGGRSTARVLPSWREIKALRTGRPVPPR
jgi:hypothetical protein